MTEEEWLACGDPRTMLELMRATGTDREFRLVGAAACRRIWELMQDDRCRAAIEASELFADGLLGETALDHASAAAEEAFETACTTAIAVNDPAAVLAAGIAHAASYSSSPDLLPEVLVEALQAIAEESPTGGVEERAIQAAIVRDVFGNPFRPVAVEPGWLTSDVLDLARMIYAERAFDRLPILADALLDAGCEHAELLDHCRSAGPHVRGCWAVDLLLGKA